MAESRIIKRNILFWGKSGLQLTGMMLIFMVVYGFLFNMGSSRVFGDFWKTAYFYGGIISVLFAMIGSVSYVGSYLPLTLSFGSGRREAVFGAQAPQTTIRLKIFDPATLLTASVLFPAMDAVTLTASSGKLVPIATIVIPMIKDGTLNFFATEELPSTK